MEEKIVIKNAGYMWHRKYVNWQSGNDLIGVCEQGEKQPINFAYQTGIYSLYNHNLECIYIGQAGSGENTGLYHRLKEHAINDYLFCAWERFSWFGFYACEALLKDQYEGEFNVKTNINKLLDTFETLAIQIIQPHFNKHMGKIEGIDWYYQEAEYEDQKIQFESLKKICKSLK